MQILFFANGMCVVAASLNLDVPLSGKNHFERHAWIWLGWAGLDWVGLRLKYAVRLSKVRARIKFRVLQFWDRIGSRLR